MTAPQRPASVSRRAFAKRSAPAEDRLPDCEGWTCQSCGADNFIPAGFTRVIPPGSDAS